MRSHLVMTVIVAASCVVVACAGGGGGSGDATSDFDFGLVSGSEPTARTLQVTNPLSEPAEIRWTPHSGAFGVDVSTLPAAPVAPGTSADVDVTCAPGAPGVTVGEVYLFFDGASTRADVTLSLRATVEEVRVVWLANTFDYGSLAFGSTAVQTTELSNVSNLSVVTYTGFSAPTTDIQVIAPAFPFVLPPGGRQNVTVRASPYRNMAPLDASCRLRAAGVQGSADFTVRITPTAGRKVIDMGLYGLTNDTTEVIDFEVPAHVWSLHVAAWRPGHPVPDYGLDGRGPSAVIEPVTPVRFESPSGREHHEGWWATNGAFAATLPRSSRVEDQLDAGGGVYRVQFHVADSPPPETELAVQVVLKASPGAVPSTTGTLDLNIWLGDRTGITPATAAQDPVMQGALQAAGQMLQQIGISIGDIDYYAYTEYSGGSMNGDMYASVRDAVPTSPGIVEERMNLFVPNVDAGFVGRVCGPCATNTNHSFVLAGLGGGLPLSHLIVHEGLHHLGLDHVSADRLPDTGNGFVPTNVMDVSVPPGGTYLSPLQGVVARAHPHVR